MPGFEPEWTAITIKAKTADATSTLERTPTGIAKASAIPVTAKAITTAPRAMSSNIKNQAIRFHVASCLDCFAASRRTIFKVR